MNINTVIDLLKKLVKGFTNLKVQKLRSYFLFRWSGMKIIITWVENMFMIERLITSHEFVRLVSDMYGQMEVMSWCNK